MASDVLALVSGHGNLSPRFVMLSSPVANVLASRPHRLKLRQGLFFCLLRQHVGWRLCLALRGAHARIYNTLWASVTTASDGMLPSLVVRLMVAVSDDLIDTLRG